MGACYNPDASRHNYSPQSAVVMTWVKRVNKSCGVLTKTNDTLLLLPLTLIFPGHPAGPTADTVTHFMSRLINSCSEQEKGE